MYFSQYKIFSLIKLKKQSSQEISATLDKGTK